jgi:DNA topoisomerase-1
LLDGRYGPYVTDGETNASLPKGTAIEELTFNEALDLLAARAAAGPPKRKSAKRKTAKAAAAKSTVPKKSATKRRTAKAATQSPKKKAAN